MLYKRDYLLGLTDEEKKNSKRLLAGILILKE